MIQSINKSKKRQGVENGSGLRKKRAVEKKAEEKQSVEKPVNESEVRESYYTEDERMILWQQSIVPTNSEMVSRFGSQQLHVSDKKIEDDISLVNSLVESYKQVGGLYDVVPSVVSILATDEIDTIQLFRTYNETAMNTVQEEIQVKDEEAPEGFEML